MLIIFACSVATIQFNFQTRHMLIIHLYIDICMVQQIVRISGFDWCSYEFKSAISLVVWIESKNHTFRN